METLGSSGRIRKLAAHPRRSLTEWNSTNPGGFTSSRLPRPKCAPTAEIFGQLPDYLEYANPSPLVEEDGDSGEDNQGTSVRDTLSPIKKRERRKLRESAGVKPKPSQERTIGPSNSRQKVTLPPKGTMRCRWGGNCTFAMAYDYSLDTIRSWKTHIASHPTRSDQHAEDSGGRVKTVECNWGGCSAQVEKGYLFKHIVTHEVRFKLLCPHGCGVAFRDDNLDRHLRSCAAYEK
ncbi:hypothetical protein BJ322DRAFT_739324 [Thelephora terrestris]|uniref:Uncharacterized protein n=1 Tax=Thelephora terrestris TaxID=56493 RepID=A0A9P6L6P2_9AGAM|nr:hypothetical protein BJ322DRAFT_739324 [Thelephora terrestris]